MNSMRDYVGTPAPAPSVTLKASLAGFVVIVPAFLVLAFGFGGAEPTLQRLGALSTFALPVIAMIAFWWQDWPGSRLRPGWSGLTDTVIVAVVALVLTEIGQLMTVGENSIPLAAAVFTVILQLTLVCDGWPFSLITRRSIRLLAGNLGVIAAGVATHVVMLDVIRWNFATVTAICGCGIAAVLVVSMLFQPAGRLWTVTAFVVATAVLYLGLSTIADQLTWSRAEPDHWVAYAAMNALGIAVILHVAVWRRWPVGGKP